jgi:hypothetical protein
MPKKVEAEAEAPSQPKKKVTTEAPATAQGSYQTLYRKLSAPIPAEAIIEYVEDGKTFTGFNAQYAIDLLNEVVGLGNWHTEEKIQKQEIIGGGWAVSMSMDLFLVNNKNGGHDIYTTGYGASYAKRIADAYKGAKTSAFKNACRFLGIGRELYYKGFEEDIKASAVTAVIEPSKEVPISSVDTPPGPAEELIEAIKRAGSKDQLNSLREKVLNFEAGETVKKLLLKRFNDKLLTFSN